MLQCQGPCNRFINPERGPQLPIGHKKVITDKYGNEIIAEIRCQDCEDGRVQGGLPDAGRATEATG